MRYSLQNKFFSANWHFIGVVFFFLLHGYLQHFSLVPIAQVLLLLVKLLVAGIILFWIGKRIYKDPRKAGIFTSFLLMAILFFGAVQDFVGGIEAIATAARLAFIFPGYILLMIAFLIWLKKTKRSFEKVVGYFNLLLLIYIIVDIGTIVFKTIQPSRQRESIASELIVTCDTCSKPSVYLIVLDEYLGFDGLRDHFKYNNHAFKNFLELQGFHVLDTARSNYSLTIFSMASILNMEFADTRGGASIQNHYAYKKAGTAIRDNVVCDFFERLGYRIGNYSDFDLKGEPALWSGELPDKIRLITNQTLYHRVGKELPHLLAKAGIEYFAKKTEDDVVRSNEEKMSRLLADSRAVDSTPGFNYLHLSMPHEPFAFDSAGRRVHRYKTEMPRSAYDDAYLQYLVYTNHRVQDLISQLKQNTAGKAVIVLMSDHGIRYIKQLKNTLGFQTLNAIYIPGKNYDSWYNGVSNVNQFRILLNTLYGAHLPMLADSAIYK